MNNKSVGMILIVAGIALALWGYDIYDSASSHVSRALSGETPIKAWAGLIGGAVCLLIGVFKIK